MLKFHAQHMPLIIKNTVTESIKAMTLEGMEIVWLLRISIQPELNRGDLIIIGDGSMSMRLDIMRYRSTQRLSNESESLWAYLNRQRLMRVLLVFKPSSLLLCLYGLKEIALLSTSQ